MNQQPGYLSYLLRLWQENAGNQLSGEAPLWRASLEGPQSDERRGFAGLEELFTYLRVLTGMVSPADALEKAGWTPVTSSESEEA
jgi:hypothetical protein